MKHKIHNKELRKKGWSETEIKKAENIFIDASKKKPLNSFDKFIFILLLLITIIGVFIIAIEIIPLLVLLNPYIMIIILLIISFVLGTLFTIVIQDIHWLEKRNHIFSIFFLGLLTIITFILVINFSTKYGGAKEPGWVAGTIFAIGLLLPYLVHLATNHRGEK